MKISEKGLNLIREFEGCRLTAYKPVAAERYYTIGYGHYGADVHAGMRITQSQADAYLEKDVAKFVASVNALGRNWTQNQFDALVSFTYNCGAASLLYLTKGRNIETIAEKILIYNKGANGRTLPGLVRRRKAEHDLFIKGTVASTLGWVQSNGKWYFRERPGVNAHGWKNIPPYRYYFNTDGSMAKGFVTINGKLYYFRESGQGEGALYVSDSDGSLHTMKV